MEGRAAIHQRLQSLVPGNEAQRFARALAALEAHHNNELHEQTRAAYEAKLKGEAAVESAAVLRHASAAKEAKLSCQIEALKSDAARRERILAAKEAQATAALERAERAEARALGSELSLARELRKLESEQAEGGKLLKEFSRAHELKSDHLLGLQQTTSQATSMVAQLQEQASSMAKKLAAQQRKTMRLQESQHLIDATAKSWAQERKALLLAASRADQAARDSHTRLQHLEAEHAALIGRVEDERRGSVSALRQTREVSAASEANLRSELRALQMLRESLLSDPCRVTLRSGGACTVAQYVKALEERQMRARRGLGSSRAASSTRSTPETDAAAALFYPPAATQAAADAQVDAARQAELNEVLNGVAEQHLPSRILLGGGGGVAGSAAFNS